MHMDTVGLLILKDRKLLLAYSRNKDCFYLPGGKIDEAESAIEALFREIREELNIELIKEQVIFYTHISAVAYGEANGIMMEQDCFLYNGSEIPVAAAEIGELRYFSLEDYLQQQRQAPGAILILEKLKKDRLID